MLNEEHTASIIKAEVKSDDLTKIVEAQGCPKQRKQGQGGNATKSKAPK
jgi:hypothetical protein